MQLVVLVNEGTASAAEISAAGLRDTTDTQLVGTGLMDEDRSTLTSF
jgi:C-terminal processing protease CtpA/Prc